MKKAFTMVELIFVIVIIGILAGVALPRFSATRDDAKISKLAMAIKTFQSELTAGIVSSNKIPQSKEELEKISNVIKESSNDYIIKVINNKTIEFIDTDSGTEICKILTINDTNISNVTLDFSDGNGTSSICKGVRKLVADTSSNFVLAGNVVIY